MINLFKIPNYQLPYLNGKVLNDGVEEFENKFAEYVGSKYACGISSATNAIFLLLKYFLEDGDNTTNISTIMPPVVANAITLSGQKLVLESESSWVGNAYFLKSNEEFSILDSAQQIFRNQFSYHKDSDLVVYSMYPTKPVAGIDGSIVVSNDKSKIDRLRQLSNNGFAVANENDSWEKELVEPGWKMYMNSVQAWVANKSLDRLDVKQEAIAENRDYLNSKLELSNISLHLYRIYVKNRDLFIKYMKDAGVVCGIHYKPLHKMVPYRHCEFVGEYNEKEDNAVSIPFHEELPREDLDYIIGLVQKWQKEY
jgi:dTDP-4-amino-4,6-dideoxygalactose transaminase